MGRSAAVDDDRVLGEPLSGRPDAGGDMPGPLQDLKVVELATEFDAVHSVARAERVGSLSGIVSPQAMRTFVVKTLREALGYEGTTR